MKYLGQTFSYLKKNLWLPILAMFIPSVVACFLSTPYWEVSFVTEFDYMPFRSAAQTFRILFGDSWQYLWPVAIVAVLQVLGAAMIMSAIDRHFRTGRLSLRDPFRMINNSLFPLAIGVAIMSVFSIIWRFLLFGLVMLVQVVSSALSFSNGAAIALISAVAVILFVLHTIIIMPMLFWAPIMSVYGYKFRDAAATSFKLISGKKLYIGFLLPMLFCVGIQLLIGFLNVHISIFWVVGFIVFMFTNVYITVYTMVSFYGISELERRDLKPYRHVPLPAPVRKQETSPHIAEDSQSSVTAQPSDITDKQQKPQSKPKQGKQSVKKQTKKTSVTASASSQKESGNDV